MRKVGNDSMRFPPPSSDLTSIDVIRYQTHCHMTLWQDLVLRLKSCRTGQPILDYLMRFADKVHVVLS